jgi:peptidyl-prolyl cis-trans isomerase C
MRTTLFVVFLAATVALGCEGGKSSRATKKEKRAATATNVTAAPGQSQADLATPLAKVDDVVITVGELQERLNRQSPYIRARYTSLEQKKEFLDSLVRFEVLAAEAERRGFDKDPEVIRTMKQVMIQKLMKDEFEVKVTPDSIPDADIKAYYDAHIDEFVKPEEVRASAIVVKSRAQADRVAKEAAGDAGKTNKGFRDMVALYTTNEDTKLRGGDLRYMTLDSKDWPKPVVEATFALVNTGDVSGVVDAGDGTFWVLKQTGRRKAMTRTLADATQQIRNKLYREKRVDAQKQFIDGLRNKAKISIDEASLSKVKIDTSTQGGDPHGESQPLPDLSRPIEQPPGSLQMPVPPPVAPPVTGSGPATQEPPR